MPLISVTPWNTRGRHSSKSSHLKLSIGGYGPAMNAGPHGCRDGKTARLLLIAYLTHVDELRRIGIQ